MEPLNKAGRVCRSTALLWALAACGCSSGQDGPGAELGSGASTASGATGSTGAGAASATGGGVSQGASGGGPSVGGTGTVGPSNVAAPANPGVVVLRRLNRNEYNNTVADLFGTKLKPASDFPGEDLGAEFYTVGSALSLSPAYVLAYEAAAYSLVDELFADSARKQKYLPCDVETGGETCARSVLAPLARRAWRRPVTDAELQTLLTPLAAAKAAGAKATDGLKGSLVAMLLSPFFIFKLELDQDPSATTPRRLNAHELATRLSYALWSTMPDDELSSAADAGKLTTDAEVTAQVNRMLASPRAEALLDTFAAEWLNTRDLEAHDVEPSVFPNYKPALATSMRLEIRRYFDEFLHSDRNVKELLNARFTFLDATLAKHYGLTRTAPSGTPDSEFVRVDTSNVPRVGLLTMGALLTTTSYPSRSSPVKRGEFVLRRLLCQEVPAPPPDIPALPDAAASSGLTLRQRTEQHRKDPACSGCHNLMDPIGFGLENYDALGSYRTVDAGTPVDASGVLPDGTSFNGAVDLAAILAKDSRFISCTTNKFMTFAVGRLLHDKDDPVWVSHLSGRALSVDGSLPSIIRAVLMSEAFRSRQARAVAL